MNGHPSETPATDEVSSIESNSSSTTPRTGLVQVRLKIVGPMKRSTFDPAAADQTEEAISNVFYWAWCTRLYLRETCRCAACVKEFTGERILKPESVPADIRAEEISLVGRYAIQVRWSDGHSTGISPFDTLWAVCACETWWRGGVR